MAYRALKNRLPRFGQFIPDRTYCVFYTIKQDVCLISNWWKVYLCFKKPWPQLLFLTFLSVIPP